MPDHLFERIRDFLHRQPVWYVTRDAERAGGGEGWDRFFVVTNDSPFARLLERRSAAPVLRIQQDRPLSTLELLRSEETRAFIKRYAAGMRPSIVVFKNTPLIEQECRARGWYMLHPPASLAESIELKRPQSSLFSRERIQVPRFRWVTPERVSWDELADEFGVPLVAQFNRSHSGGGARLLSCAREWEEVVQAFPRREVKVSEWVSGVPLTVNGCIGVQKDAVFSVSVQITGKEPFTKEPLATVGNDWSAGSRFLEYARAEEMQLLVAALRMQGWRGLFGADMVMEHATGNMYIIEVNARQPASAVCESSLLEAHGAPYTTMQAHIAALLGIGEPEEGNAAFPVPLEGSQLVVRSTRRETVRVCAKCAAGEYDRTLSWRREADSVADVSGDNIFFFPRFFSGQVRYNEEIARIQAFGGVLEGEECAEWAREAGKKAVAVCQCNTS